MVRSFSFVLAMITALLVTFVALTAHAEDAPLTILKAENSYDVRADGTYISLYRLEMRANNDAAARREGQQSVSYSPAMEELQVVEAFTRKADGRVLKVDAASVHDQLVPGTSDRALITDLREKVLVFPDLAGGDTLVYAVRRVVRQPIFPDRFMAHVYLSRAVPLLDYTLTVRAPRTLALRAEAFEMTETDSTQGDMVVRSWHASLPQASDEASAVGPYDHLPRVFVSTEPDYAAFARDYANLALPHARLTPSVQALAERVTAGIAGRREQARALYEWVNAHVRYVAVYLAAGALEPHDAETVIAHGWGDCKDHAVLLQALLAARGIPAELVMLNFGNHYTLSGPPTFAQLNHAITYLPEFDLYVDSTAALAPFGTLPFGEYGKPAVHAVPGGVALRRIPPLPDGAASVERRTSATLQEDGSVAGSTSITATGPFSIELRRDAAWAQSTGSGAAAAQLRALGSEGSGSFAFAPPQALADSYTVNGRFALDARPEWLDGDSFAPPAGLRLLAPVGDELIGPLYQRSLHATDPTPCYAGRQTEEIALTLPQGRHLMKLPKEVRVETEAFSYRSVWSLSGRTLTRRAELTSRIATPLCEGELRQSAAHALEAIRRAERARVSISDE